MFLRHECPENEQRFNMKLKTNNRYAAGSSLAEVTIAIAIIATVAGSMIGVFNFGFVSASLVRENQRATQVMLEKVETLRLYNWDQVNTAGFIPSSFTEVYDPQSSNAQAGVTYYGSLSIGAVPFSPAPAYNSDIRQLTVTVTWTNQLRNVVRTRQLTTLIAKDGVQNYVY